MTKQAGITFKDRCATDPLGVIKDLVAQTSRQAAAIHQANIDKDACCKKLAEAIEHMRQAKNSVWNATNIAVGLTAERDPMLQVGDYLREVDFKLELALKSLEENQC